MGFVTHSERIGSTETPEAGGSGLWTSLLSVVLALGASFLAFLFLESPMADVNMRAPESGLLSRPSGRVFWPKKVSHSYGRQGSSQPDFLLQAAHNRVRSLGQCSSLTRCECAAFAGQAYCAGPICRAFRQVRQARPSPSIWQSASKALGFSRCSLAKARCKRAGISFHTWFLVRVRELGTWWSRTWRII